MIHVGLADGSVDPARVLDMVGGPEDGAILLFLGTVRNHHEGRAVTGLRYEAYEEMATPVLQEIAREGAELMGAEKVAVVHGVGELGVGDVSVVIAVSSPHRAEAYEASRYIIEEIKKRLPVWKDERYSDGTRDWVEGVRPMAPSEEGP